MSPTLLWFIAGAFFIAIEIFGVPGLGFLFAGIGAVLIGALIEFGVLAPEDYLTQFVLFFIAACVSAMALWKKLKRNPKPSYSNMVGDEAVVTSNGLTGNQEGQVRWSGTLMRARLVPNSGLDVVAKDAVVVIKNVEGNVLFVAPRN